MHNISQHELWAEMNIGLDTSALQPFQVILVDAFLDSITFKQSQKLGYSEHSNYFLIDKAVHDKKYLLTLYGQGGADA